MAALLGADLEKARAIAAAAAEGEVCAVANDNDPGQVAISGAKGAIERAVAMAKDHGAKRALLLPVSAPFHCPLMQPAADAMAEALAKARSEEHTSELQSLMRISYAVFCLKKKKKRHTIR